MPNSYFENVRQIIVGSNMAIGTKLRTPVNRTKWPMNNETPPPFSTNAVYTPSLNQFSKLVAIIYSGRCLYRHSFYHSINY